MEIYSPIQVLKNVDDHIWIVDGPLISFKGVPFPTRMTVIRLESGELFMHSPIELNDKIKAEIDQLGSVMHLISPNKIHYWWIDQWAKAYPDLIENFESKKVQSRFLEIMMKLAGNLDPDGKLPIDLRFGYFGRHAALQSSVKTMLSWHPERIILAHGRWYSSNGTAELRRAFRWVKGIE